MPYCDQPFQIISWPSLALNAIHDAPLVYVLTIELCIKVLVVQVQAARIDREIGAGARPKRCLFFLFNADIKTDMDTLFIVLANFIRCRYPYFLLVVMTSSFSVF